LAITSLYAKQSFSIARKSYHIGETLFPYISVNLHNFS